MPETTLNNILNFDEAALAANRNGRLTEKQKGLLTIQTIPSRSCPQKKARSLLHSVVV